MKATKDILCGAVACSYLFLFAGCADSLWHLAQASPSLGRLSDRMNERALQRRLSSDPLAELSANVAAGDYRFQGILDTQTLPNRE